MGIADCSVRGFSLIAMAMLISALGLMIVGGTRLLSIDRAQRITFDMHDQMDVLNNALAKFYEMNGRYPCPASLSAVPDSAAFGVEVSSVCTTDTLFPGTFQATGDGGRRVRTGAIPVRTLNIDDRYMFDQWRHRIFYAVTEAHAVEGTIETGGGGIVIRDANANNSTSSEGNIVYALVSTGGDSRGAFSYHGALVSVCDAAAPDTVNCRHEGEYTNTLSKGTTGTDDNSYRISYSESRRGQSPCTDITTENNIVGKKPGKMAYLVDTSGSMAWNAGKNACPAHMPNCSRWQLAYWALRNVIPSRVEINKLDDTPQSTHMSGFVNTSSNGSNLRPVLEKKLINETSLKEDKDFDNLVKGLGCPTGGTPLGNHIRGFALAIGNGTEERPNKIMVVSDGENTHGENPVTVAKWIQKQMPYLQVDVIDMVGLPSLKQIAELTGGTYYYGSESSSIIQSMMTSTYACGALVHQEFTAMQPPAPTYTPTCK